MSRTILVTLSAWLGLQGLAWGQSEVTPAPVMPAQTGTPVLFGTETAPRRGLDIWVGGDYLLWFTKGMHLPPLVTGNAPGTPLDQIGALDNPGTIILVGNESVLTNMRSGLRITAGISVFEHCALEATFFQLGGRSDTHAFRSEGGTLLTRPFFDVTTGRFNSELVAFPGIVQGSVGVNIDADAVYGAELMLRKCWSFADPNMAPEYLLCMWHTSRVAVMAGYRFLHMEEGVSITENLTATAANNPDVPAGTRFNILDHFGTVNEFNGLQVGGLWEARSGPFSFNIVGKIAFGRTQRRVDINGFTVITVPGQAPAGFGSGILAATSNSGSHEDDAFSIVPEVCATFGYDITDHCRITIGYSYLYWSNVARAGTQIDLNVNPTLFPPPTTVVGPVAPQFNLRDSSWWAQGLHAGLEVRF